MLVSGRRRTAVVIAIISLLASLAACSKKNDKEDEDRSPDSEEPVGPACANDADCAATPGQICDAQRKVCVDRPEPAKPTRDPALAQCENRPVLEKKLFGPVTQLSGPREGSTSNQEVHAAVAADGSLTAAYINRKGRFGPHPMTVSTISVDGKVDGDRVIESDRDRHFDPWMLTDKQGVMHLVWLGYKGMFAPEKDMMLPYTTSTDGKTWTPIRSIHDPKDCPNGPDACLDKPEMNIGPDKEDPSREAIYLSYWANDGQYVRKSVDGGKTWQPSVRNAEMNYGSIEVDSAGDVHIVGVTSPPKGKGMLGDPEGRVLYVVSKDGGASFSKPVSASPDGASIPGRFANPQVISDAARGALYVFYPAGAEATRAWDIIAAVSQDQGKTWSHRKVNDDATCANHMLPVAVLDEPTGQVHVMWVENRNDQGQVAYTTCVVESCAPNQRISEQPFLDYGFTRHTDTWLGEYNKLVLDRKHNVLHAVWAQPIDEGGSARNRIFHARAPLPPQQ